MSCFLQGIKYGIKHGHNHLARVLYLLSFDNQTGAVSKAFDKYCDSIPQWVWLAWIPQLLLSLQRPEAASCKNVILKLAAVFPQVGPQHCTKVARPSLKCSKSAEITNAVPSCLGLFTSQKS